MLHESRLGGSCPNTTHLEAPRNLANAIVRPLSGKVEHLRGQLRRNWPLHELVGGDLEELHRESGVLVRNNTRRMGELYTCVMLLLHVLL